MSCPGLRLHICADVIPEVVGRYLGLDFTQAEEWSPGRFTLQQHLGGIEVSYDVPALEPLPDLDNLTLEEYFGGPELLINQQIWNLIVCFDFSYSWSYTAHVLGLHLTRWLADDFPGVYLCRLSTGGYMWRLQNDVLEIDSEDVEYFSRYPMPYGQIQFADLNREHREAE